MSDLNTSAVGSREIFRLWAPLALTWVAMSLEGPMLTSFVARMPDAIPNLAAWGLSIALTLVCESPILGLITASISLAANRRSYFALRRFALFHCAVSTVAVLSLTREPVFSFLSTSVLHLGADVQGLFRSSVVYLAPSPFAVGYRRFYQGIVIRSGSSRLVAIGSIGRILVMLIFAVLLYQTKFFAGSELASVSITAGLIFEALFARYAAGPAVRSLLADDANNSMGLLSFVQIARFYYPFAFSIIIALSIVPVVSLFLARTPRSVEALALFPVLNALTQIFRSAGYAYQEVVVAVARFGAEVFPELKRFAARLSIVLVALLAVIAFTPLAERWFGGVNGLESVLVAQALLPLRLLAVSPALAVIICYQRGLFVAANRTHVITVSGIVEIGMITAVMAICVRLQLLPGLTAAAISLLAGAASGCAWFARANAIRPVSTARVLAGQSNPSSGRR